MIYLYLFGVCFSWVLNFLIGGVCALVFVEAFVFLVFFAYFSASVGMLAFFFIYTWTFVFLIAVVPSCFLDHSYLWLFFTILLFKFSLGLVFVVFLKDIDYFFLFFYVYVSEVSVFNVGYSFYSAGDMSEFVSVFSEFFDYFFFLSILYIFFSCFSSGGKGFMFCLYSFDSAISVCVLCFSLELFLINFFFNSLLFFIFYLCMGSVSSGTMASVVFKTILILFSMGLPPFPVFFVNPFVFSYVFYSHGVIFFIAASILYSFAVSAMVYWLISCDNNIVGKVMDQHFVMYFSCLIVMVVILSIVFFLVPWLIL